MDLSEINRIAHDLRSRGIAPTENPKHEDVNRLFMGLLQYANNLLRSKVKDPFEREDVAQEACRKAVETFETFDPKAGEYSKLFAYSIVPKALINHRTVQNAQKRTPQGGVFTPEDQAGFVDHREGDPRDNVERLDFWDVMRQNALPKERQVLDDLFEGHSFAEISRRSDCAPTTVTNRLSAAYNRVLEPEAAVRGL
ncbi:MAG: sigma-70 family RNA polymerase sigma factor [Alphaproteobacteria bacterium]|nr:sigma-70 family RNA polymerase sigma factor [Alphaproteobacteria bacterium]